MAIIVNKAEKRRAIALSCSKLLLDKGIRDLTISQIAETAGVGKGTIYEYFENKDDIVFEIITTYMIEHEKRLSEIIDKAQTTKEKLFHWFYTIFDDRDKKQLGVYNEFLAISLVSGTEDMAGFSAECKTQFASILNQIIEEAIANGEIKPEATRLVGMMMIFEKGLVVDSKVSGTDVKQEINDFLDVLFDLIEIRS